MSKKGDPEHDKKLRRKVCLREIEVSLLKYNCVLYAEMTISKFGNRPFVDVMPLDKKEEKPKIEVAKN